MPRVEPDPYLEAGNSRTCVLQLYPKLSQESRGIKMKICKSMCSIMDHYMHCSLPHQDITWENQSVVLTVPSPSSLHPLGCFCQPHLQFSGSAPSCLHALTCCLFLDLLCRGGAELLFDGVKKHQVTLPGQEEPCEYLWAPLDKSESVGSLIPIQVGMA